MSTNIIFWGVIMSEKIKILLCEDQEIVSEGIAESLIKEENFEVVKIIQDAALIIDNLKELDVDIILTDIITSNKHNVLDYIEKIKELYPKIKIITITGFPDISFMDKAKEVGVNSFIYKNVGTKELISLINNTFYGYYVYPSKQITNDLIISSLDETELKILRLYISGYERDEIANTLYMSNSSVKAYISSILRKTGFSSLARVAIYAVANHLIVPEEK